MFISDIMLALILGFFFAAIFSSTRRSREALINTAFVFLLFFLFAWAGGLWIRPFGPALFGVTWVPGLIITTLLFLLLVSLIPGSPAGKTNTREEKAAENTAVAAIGMAFWILVAGLVGAIILGYFI